MPGANPFAALESSDSDDDGRAPPCQRVSQPMQRPAFDASRRLMRDLREVRAAMECGQLPTIAAEPADDNILEWRLTMTAPDGKYHGVVFHAEMNFTREYPDSPPVIKLCTDLPHPNVFSGYDFNHHRARKGHYICLDMLKPATSGTHSGWSTAYSVLSILQQLQSFLFAEYIPQDSGRRIKSYLTNGRRHGGREDSGGVLALAAGLHGTAAAEEMQKRLAREGARTGEITVSLIWDSTDDLDLHCVGPTGDEIAYFHRRGTCGGELDVDMNACRPYSLMPVENIHWQVAPKGRYRVWVENFCHRDERRHQITFTCVLRRKGMPPLQHDGTWSPKVGCQTAGPAVFDFSWSGPPDLAGETVLAANAFHERHGRHYPPLPMPLENKRTKPAAALEAATSKSKHSTQVVRSNAFVDASVDWRDIDDDVWLAICQLLQPDAISALLRTCKHFGEFGDIYRVFTRRELLCFHTRCLLDEPNQTLGICLRTKRRTPRTGQLCSSLAEVSCEFDLLSESAFVECGVRRGVWGTKFDSWLPLVLDQRHAQRALPLLERYISQLASPSLAASSTGAGFNPMAALEVLPRIMNAMVVSLMEHGETSLFSSEKALLGFCALHHMLLELAVRYPIIAQRAQYWVKQFEEHPACRNKHVIHDLGELLVLIYLCPKDTWSRIAPVFIQEVLVRNVRWNIDKDKSLALLEPAGGNASDYRLQATLRCCGTSLRLCMFQAFFLLNVGALPSGDISQMTGAYRSRLSRPRPGTAAKLQAACVDILGVGARNAQNRLSWGKFFRQMALPEPTNVALSERLRAAVVTSELRGYHRRLDGYEMEEAMVTRATLDAGWCQQQKSSENSPAPNDAASWRPRGGYKVFVGNCPYRCSEADLATLFRPFGSLIQIELPVATGPEAEAAAERTMLKTVAEAREILIEHGALRAATHIQVDLCHSHGLGGTGQVVPQLKAVNQMSDVDVIRKAVELRPSWRGGQRALDSNGAAPRRGFAFVHFVERDAAAAAVQYGNGQLVLGRRMLKVSWAAARSKARQRHRPTRNKSTNTRSITQKGTTINDVSSTARAA